MSEDFVITHKEAKRLRKRHKLHGALILTIICVVAYIGPPLGKKVIRGLMYPTHHTERYMKCTECNMKNLVVKTKGMSLGEIKENDFECPYCNRQHGNLCRWCGNELF